MPYNKYHHFLLVICCPAMLGVYKPLLSQSAPRSKDVIEINLPEPRPASAKKVDILLYDKKLYELAYRVYLYNANIDDAYAVAYAAMQQTSGLKQDNIFWRDRLADVAQWKKMPQLAMEQYLYLVKKFDDNTALTKGLTLATQMQEDVFLIQLLKVALRQNPHNLNYAEKIVNAWLRLGDIDEAKAFLDKHGMDISEPFYLLAEAKTDRLVSDLNGQLDALQKYTKKYGSTPKLALDMAKIYVSQSKFDLAAQTLFSVKEIALHSKGNMSNFWEAYVSMAKITQNPEQQRKGYLQLLKQLGASEEAFTNLISLYGNLNPEIAYHYAKLGKKYFPNNVSLTVDAFSWALQNSAWDDFPLLDKKIPPVVRNELMSDAAYGEVKANYLQSLGQHQAAVGVFWETVNYLSFNPSLKSDFIYFLIHSSDLPRLTKILYSWNTSDLFAETSWGAYAEGFTQLNNLAMALPALQLNYDHFKEHQSDPYWLIAFKDILESTFFPEQSWAVAHYAWSLYLPLLASQKTPFDYIQVLDYLKLSLSQAPGDVSAYGLAVLEKDVNPDVELLLLTWALDKNNIALADAIYSYYRLLNIVPPAWAVLSIALKHEDHVLMRDLLIQRVPKISSTPSKISSYRDKILAAQKIDSIPLGQTIAFNSLAEHPHDSELYDNFYTPIMLKTASALAVSQEFYQYSNVEGPRNVLSYAFSPTSSVQLKPYHSIWFSNQLKDQPIQINKSIALSSQVITNVPEYDERMGVQMRVAQNRGDLIINAGARRDLDSFATLRVQREYLVYHDLNTVLDLGYHQPSEDSLGLLVGGMKNDVHLSAAYTMTSHYHD